jgi:hypothetical protein
MRDTQTMIRTIIVVSVTNPDTMTDGTDLSAKARMITVEKEMAMMTIITDLLMDVCLLKAIQEMYANRQLMHKTTMGRVQ